MTSSATISAITPHVARVRSEMDRAHMTNNNIRRIAAQAEGAALFSLMRELQRALNTEAA